MTSTPVRPAAPDAGRPAIHIPSPRIEVAPPTAAAPSQDHHRTRPQHHDTADLAVRQSRRSIVPVAMALDVLIALAIAIAAAGLDLLGLRAAAVTALAWPVVLLAAGHYRRAPLGRGRFSHIGLVLGTGLRGAVLALAVSQWSTRVDLVGLAALVTVLSLASAVRPALGLRQGRPRLVLAGRPRDVREVMLELQSDDTHDVVAVCLTRESKVPLGDLPAYLGLATSSEVARRHHADALVVLPGARLTHAEVRRLHWALAGVGAELYLGTGLLDVAPQRTRVVSHGGIDILHVTSPDLDGPRRLIKDVVERALALGAFLMALPLLAALCLAIRLETPGPALFRQERVGRNGIAFTMLKLRSMGVDAETVRAELNTANENDGILFKIRADPRITPLGARLRKYSLDELPQLWNVVRGDMSLVGPRPALPSEVALYDIDPRRRLVVKPGVTGLWQVSGRSDLTWAESVRLDLKYVDNWSLGLDVRILVRTVRAVLGHRGAY